jgi:hypothetical protein
MRRIASYVVLPLAAMLVAAAPVRDPSAERLVLHLDETAPSFRPDRALGAALDGTERGGVDQILTTHNMAAMTGAGLRPLAYRSRTELGIEAWHWNPAGSWSDPADRQGYWTSSAKLGKPIRLSWGYHLPRRGDTMDEANDRDYSRLTDGDRATFWKSNPYLDSGVLKDGTAHPQWAVLRLDRKRQIDAAVIDWGEPYATRYEVQYWTGEDEYDGSGRWVSFPGGAVTDGHGGQVQLTLAAKPIETSHVRVLLEQDSGTAPPGSTDWRDRAGYAVREISFGLRRADGSFEDAVAHDPSNARQTWAHVSSTDPWHRASDRDPDLEQPGLDRVLESKLASGAPVMIPTGLLYDTPQNVRNELRYVAQRHYDVGRIEDVVAYALRRPDRRISLLLINRNASRAHSFALVSQAGQGREVPLSGPATVFSYGRQQYSWIDQGEQSHPGRDLLPARRRIAKTPLTLEVAPSSMAVVVLDR